jgi:putative transcriptional regulator
MTKRNLANELIEGLEEIRAWKRGEVKLTTHTVELPRAADVPEIRKALGYSQEEFASLMGVSVATLRNWEQARREPHGPARSLLLVASTNPAAVRGAFEKLARVQRKRRAAR